MATLQNLSNQQIDEVLNLAAEKQVPAAIIVRDEGEWASFRTRFVGMSRGHILLEMPAPQPGEEPGEFSPADKVGVSFKLRHHKHLFNGTVAETGTVRLDDGSVQTVLHVCSPTRMQRMQRRAFNRTDVPPNRVVRAAFWVGGLESEPAGTTPDQPVWSGRVVNISAGGLQLVCGQHLGEAVSAGDIVGVRVSFGVGEQNAYADAQLRHAQTDDDGRTHLGFQFIGLGLSPQSCEALQIIGTKANQFQRELSRPVPHAST